jgi:hypothetical protein
MGASKAATSLTLSKSFMDSITHLILLILLASYYSYYSPYITYISRLILCKSSNLLDAVHELPVDLYMYIYIYVYIYIYIHLLDAVHELHVNGADALPALGQLSPHILILLASYYS